MTEQRLTEAEVEDWDAQRLVDQFEVQSRLLFGENDSMETRSIKDRNLNVLRQEIFRRIGNC